MSPVGFIGIICLASTLNLMYRQITHASSSLSKEEDSSNTKPLMNLVCSQASAYGVWNFWSFVYNQSDPTGKDLNKLFDKPSIARQTRYIDGVAYSGFLFRPSIALGQGEFSHFNFSGTVVKVNLKNFCLLNDKYIIYSGQVQANPALPQVGDSLFIRQFYDKAHVKKKMIPTSLIMNQNSMCLSKQTNKQTNKQTKFQSFKVSKFQTNKQSFKVSNKQTNKQTNKNSH